MVVAQATMNVCGVTRSPPAEGPREGGPEAEKTQGQVLGFISAQVPIRLSGEPCLGPDETSPICGQREQPLKYKKSLLKNAPAVSTAGRISWHSFSSIERSRKLINISELAVFNPALVPSDVCSLSFQKETGAGG